ncbi:uncharacterized protein LOC120258056 [Dioscorea cayenensis subsp. rotundata]|uniref:Uncharacterized protein LOC120258056 n=1 Tax=Dioscorea cayennensis subsp. rotundata TaxID=55577 RepID=A0AB40B1V2_DIOCR|nr:uncharacterized protein LOC120258056 [Dioscorea cayenensis subsp. rotundata]
MASGGQFPQSLPRPHSTQSWAQVASSSSRTPAPSPLHNPDLLVKLKNSSPTFVKFDGDSLSRAHQRFQHALFGKFFGKPPPFEQVKKSLMDKWAFVGELQISDLPNGFLLIRCPSHDASQHLLTNGPWSINGLTLQLAPWKPFFEPVFAKLTTAAVWVQLHNLPIELWDGESLDTVTAHMGNLLKIDDLTFNLTRSKFARVCIDLDLSKPLSRGFWVGDDSQRVFVVVLYERLPTFCYTCGVIGHGSKSCPHATIAEEGRTSPSLRDPRRSAVSSHRSSDIAAENVDMDHASDQPQGEQNPPTDPPDSKFGSWMLVSRRRGRARSRGAGSFPVSAFVGAAAEETTAPNIPVMSHPEALGLV